MAIARSAHVRDFTAPAATPARSKTPSFFERLYAAMALSRQRQAEREIARYLRGNKFTDDAEREIERRFFGPDRW